MKINHFITVVAFFVLLTGGILLKNQIEKTSEANTELENNSKSIAGIEKIITDSIKSNHWNNFDKINCTSNDPLENSQMLKEVKENLQKNRISGFDISSKGYLIKISKKENAESIGEEVLTFNVQNSNNSNKCILPMN